MRIWCWKQTNNHKCTLFVVLQVPTHIAFISIAAFTLNCFRLHWVLAIFPVCFRLWCPQHALLFIDDLPSISDSWTMQLGLIFHVVLCHCYAVTWVLLEFRQLWKKYCIEYLISRNSTLMPYFFAHVTNKLHSWGFSGAEDSDSGKY